MNQWDFMGRDIQRVIFQCLFCSHEDTESMKCLLEQEEWWKNTRLVCKQWRELSDSLFDFKTHGALERSIEGNCVQSLVFILKLGTFDTEKVTAHFHECLYLKRWNLADVFISHPPLSEFKENYTHMKRKKMMASNTFLLNLRLYLPLSLICLPFFGLMIATIVILIITRDVQCRSKDTLSAGICLEAISIVLLIWGSIKVRKGRESATVPLSIWPVFILPIPLCIWGINAIVTSSSDCAKSSQIGQLLKASGIIAMCLIPFIWIFICTIQPLPSKGDNVISYHKDTWKKGIKDNV
eukprot:TRINITY_DN6830_c0_g1_i1.p1 TRINITY_DN6830_c0_g1~~TRINITY_DN6830_c0_g1_i1.p1  ORF type:complete len:296 (-),score=59.64 TRINITY_DN6830_c0_g1_i1:272-1159(-)